MTELRLPLSSQSFECKAQYIGQSSSRAMYRHHFDAAQCRSLTWTISILSSHRSWLAKSPLKLQGRETLGKQNVDPVVASHDMDWACPVGCSLAVHTTGSSPEGLDCSVVELPMQPFHIRYPTFRNSKNLF